MLEQNLINLENFDNKSENYILKSILLDNKVKGKIKELFNFLNKIEKINIYPEDGFISKFYKKIGFIEESLIGNTQKKELIFLLFGDNGDSFEDINLKIKYFSQNIEKFRELNIEKKGFILYFIELLIETKININDEYYNILIKTKTDKSNLIYLSSILVIEGLKVLNDEIIGLLNSYHNFFDKYISFDTNYLQDQELDWFKDHFYDFFNNLFIEISMNNDVVEKIDEIKKKIENNIILD